MRKVEQNTTMSGGETPMAIRAQNFSKFPRGDDGLPTGAQAQSCMVTEVEEGEFQYTTPLLGRRGKVGTYPGR